jgi:hypothetical protein
MVAKKNQKDSEPRRRPRFIRGWLLGLMALSGAALYFYYDYQKSQESLLNSYYLGTLGEVAAEFDARVDQLLRLHEYGQSIKASFPSYRVKIDEDDDTPEVTRTTCSSRCSVESLSITANVVTLQLQEKPAEKYMVDIEDLISFPRGDFAAYLLVGNDNEVLGATGGMGALSIVNTRDIGVNIWEETNRDWLKLAAEYDGAEPPDDVSLPGYSYDIDMELATGDARIFVYPFAAHPRLSPYTESRIYIVGVVPKNLLAQKENRRWQVSVLILSLVGLGFLWTTLRLFMLSSQQPISGTFYAAALAFSYLMFVLSAALLFSWGEQRAEVEHKHFLAKSLMGDIAASAGSDLDEVFRRLDNYREFYRSLLELDTATPTPEESRRKNDTLTNDEVDELFSVLDTLSPVDEYQHVLGALPPRESVWGIVLRDGRRWRLKGGGYEPYNVECDRGPEEHSVSSEVEFRCENIPEPVLRENDRPLNLIKLFGPGADFLSNQSFDVWFESGAAKPGKILNVFTMNENGTQTLPVFYFIESNNEPRRYPLAHRDYFKKIRDQRGWTEPTGTTAEEEAGSPRKFYIQRLLNLDTGTRGTSLGTPLTYPGESGETQSENLGMVLGSDIALPSLSLIEPLSLGQWKATVSPDKDDEEEAPNAVGGREQPSRATAAPNRHLLLDMTAMVVDQRNGKVLYHLDDDRSMIENFFQAGHGTEAVSQIIRNGRSTSDKPITGFYHGERGWFHTRPLSPIPWSLVVFVPAANTDSYMTNLFLMSVASMTGALLIFGLGLLLVRRTMDTEALKKATGIPLSIDRLRLMLFASVLIAVVQLGYWLGSALERDLGNEHLANYSLLLAIGALLLAMTLGVFDYWRCCRQPYETRRSKGNSRLAATALAAVFLMLGALSIEYLHMVGKQPIAALEWYYNVLHDARLNKERDELRNVALTRFPNSITRKRVDPLDLMPISDSWRTALRSATATNVPDDVGTFSQLTASTGPGQWVQRYLLADAPGSEPYANDSKFPRWGPEARYYVIMSAYFLLLALIWIWFNVRVLSPRLFGTPGLLGHLTNLAVRGRARKYRLPEDDMCLDLTGRPANGLSLGLLLQEAREHDESQTLAREFGPLLSLCPLLERVGKLEDPFPCLKVRFSGDEDMCCIELWDLEDSLAQHDQRDLLLRLLNQLQSLRVAKKIAGVRIYLGFHTLERLLLKANMLTPSEDEGPWLSSREYSAWAECLMGFRVKLPDDLVDLVDPDVIQQESRHFPVLEKLVAGPEGRICGDTSRTPDTRRWTDLRDWQKDPSEWASISAILLSAGALFRYRWESCSTAERLALYHLALHKRINPFNTELLEQLALKCLIIVERGRIRIVNNSFAYFVRHAEDPQTFKDLVETADAGPWQDYRLPVTLLILVGLVAIALTSGNSLYVIAASLLGLLGTLGTLTNSARLIQENLNR